MYLEMWLKHNFLIPNILNAKGKSSIIWYNDLVTLVLAAAIFFFVYCEPFSTHFLAPTGEGGCEYFAAIAFYFQY